MLRKWKTPPLQETLMHGWPPFSFHCCIPVFIVAANEIKDKYVGGVSPSAFLDVFLLHCLDGMPTVDVASFNTVVSKTKEPEMYNPLVCVSCKTNTSIAQG
jgi:hypothetical protein